MKKCVYVVSEITVRTWISRFKEGNYSNEDDGKREVKAFFDSTAEIYRNDI